MSANTRSSYSENTGKQTATFKELFSLATPVDILLMIAGSIGSVGMGVAMPTFNILFGQIINQLNYSGSSFEQLVGQLCLIFVYVGIGTIFFGYVVSILIHYTTLFVIFFTFL